MNNLQQRIGSERIDGGRDIFGQLMIGARNSITIGVAITVIAGFLGLMIWFNLRLFRR